MSAQALRTRPRPRKSLGEGGKAAAEVMPHRVVSFPIRPGTLSLFGDAMADGGGPRIKCYKGDLTLVSRGKTHETYRGRLGSLILAVCSVLKIPHFPLGSTYFDLPDDVEGSGYEPDEA